MHYKLTVIPAGGKDRIINIHDMINPRNIAESLHFREVEIGSPEPGDTKIMIGDLILKETSVLFNAFDHLVGPADAFPVPYSPTGLLYRVPNAGTIKIRRGLGADEIRIIITLADSLSAWAICLNQSVGIYLQITFCPEEILG